MILGVIFLMIILEAIGLFLPQISADDADERR